MGILLAITARAATITIVGTLSSQSGSSSCLYTSINEDGLGNWTINCGTGNKSVIISPSPSAATCSSYAAISEDSLGNWVVAGCVSPGPPPPTIFYVHSDHLGTARVITRSSDNQIVWRWDNTEPFGASAANDNPAGVGSFRWDMRFPGQRYDGETGTHYNYFRDYGPVIGRYLQSDPIGLKGGINTYAYVNDSPLRYSDVQGLNPGMGGSSDSCELYTKRCAESGETSFYYCRAAPIVCRNTPDLPWTRCVRQCLQDFDMACSRNSDGSPSTNCVITAHIHCWKVCPEPPSCSPSK